MSSSKFDFQLKAPRSSVYRALAKADFIAKWRVPEGMTSEIHEFEAKEGGKFRISLSYHDPKFVGKSTSHADTYIGYLKKLVPKELVIEVGRFETTDPTMTGEMTSSFHLSDRNGGTDLVATHEGLPEGVRPEDNEAGWRQSLEKLAELLNQGSG